MPSERANGLHFLVAEQLSSTNALQGPLPVCNVPINSLTPHLQPAKRVLKASDTCAGLLPDTSRAPRLTAGLACDVVLSVRPSPARTCKRPRRHSTSESNSFDAIIQSQAESRSSFTTFAWRTPPVGPSTRHFESRSQPVSCRQTRPIPPGERSRRDKTFILCFCWKEEAPRAGRGGLKRRYTHLQREPNAHPWGPNDGRRASCDTPVE